MTPNGVTPAFIEKYNLDGSHAKFTTLPFAEAIGIAIATPEPSSLALATFGFAGLAAWGWRRSHLGRA